MATLKSNISVIVTVFNEANTIEQLLTALEQQTIQPMEVVIVDGGSSDETWSLLQRLHHTSTLKLRIFQQPGNRSVGRNFAINQAKSFLIAITDAGCVPHPDWLAELGQAYQDTPASVIAGYYSAWPETPFEEAVIPYVLVMPDRVDPQTFLPATRSMLIEKKVWQEVGGFDEQLSDNEDYEFARRLKRDGYVTTFAPKARVRWLPRTGVSSFARMIYRFARGDVQAGIVRPKVLAIFGRYLVALAMVSALVVTGRLSLALFMSSLGLLAYATWAIFKNLKYTPNGWLWLPVLQIISDWEVMSGSLAGWLRQRKR